MPVNLYTIGRKFQRDLAAGEKWAVERMLARIRAAAAELEAELQALDRLGKLTPSKIRQINRAKAGLDRIFREMYLLPPDLHRLGAGLALEHVRQAAAAQLGKYAGAITLGEGDIGLGENLRTAAGLQQSGAIKRLFASAQGQTTNLIETLFNYHLARQSGPMALARDLRAVHRLARSRAETIARTELHRTYRETTRRVYEQNADLIQRYIWVSSRGRRTCAVCWAMHGTLHDTSEPFGTHPNCRCVMVPYMGGPIPVTAGVDEFEALSDAEKMRILGPKKFKAYNEQGIPLGYVVGYKYHPDYGPVRYLQNAKEFEGRLTVPGAWGRGLGPGAPRPPRPPKPPPPPPKPKPPIAAAKKKVAAAKAAAPPAARKVPIFKDVPEAEKWAAKEFDLECDFAVAIRQAGRSVDYMPLQFAQETVEELAELAEEFPAVINRLKYVGTYKKTTQFRLKFSGEIAHASTDGFRIGLNPSYYGNEKAFLQAVEHCGKTGFTYQKIGSVRATLRHEFGHHVDYWIRRLERYSVADRFFMDDAGMFREVMKPFRSAIRANLRWAKRNSSAALTRLTKYGYKNDYEMFAETFSGLKYGPAARSDFARRFEAMLNEFKSKDIVEFDTTSYFNPTPKTLTIFLDPVKLPFATGPDIPGQKKKALEAIRKRFDQWKGFTP